MRVCPNCQAVCNSLKLQGWIVYGVTTLESFESKEEYGLIVPQIAVNESGFKENCKAICGFCNYTSDINAFSLCFTCVLTENVGNTPIEFQGQEYWISAAAMPEMEKLLSIPLKISLEYYLSETECVD